MLTKRTNILFNEEVFQYLIALAHKKNKSVGDLVRKAVIKVYYKNNNNKQSKRAQAIDKIIRMRKSIKPISSKEIRELIEYGRKY
jgi:hypothetical protein